jgi:DNA-binding MarR family transcriptional regulator
MPRRLAYDPVEGSRQHWIAQGWDDAASGVAVVVSIMRVEQTLRAKANEILRPLNLTFARYQVLGVVRGRPPVTLGEIGERLWITPGTVTSSIDRLETAGLLRRVPHPQDARAIRAEITAKGRRVFDRAVDALNQHLFGAIDLPDDELDHLVRILGKMRTAAGDVIGVLGPIG